MYFKDPQNKPHFIDKIQDAYLLPPGCTSITDAEAESLRLAALPTPPQPTLEEIKNAADLVAAKVYPKLIALRDMTPAQVQAWVAANVNNLADAKDALATLAIAVSILARRL